jgi:hypothetical protein
LGAAGVAYFHYDIISSSFSLYSQFLLLALGGMALELFGPEILLYKVYFSLFCLTKSLFRIDFI